MERFPSCRGPSATIHAMRNREELGDQTIRGVTGRSVRLAGPVLNQSKGDGQHRSST
jgi:hypothetical protein